MLMLLGSIRPNFRRYLSGSKGKSIKLSSSADLYNHKFYIFIFIKSINGFNVLNEYQDRFTGLFTIKVGSLLLLIN